MKKRKNMKTRIAVPRIENTLKLFIYSKKASCLK